MKSLISKDQLLEKVEFACIKQGISSTIVKKFSAIQLEWEKSQRDVSS